MFYAVIKMVQAIEGLSRGYAPGEKFSLRRGLRLLAYHVRPPPFLFKYLEMCAVYESLGNPLINVHFGGELSANWRYNT
jgi:hypothetical protein